MEHVDVFVIGGGPGGYVAAIRAAQLGFSVALAEKDALGGVCLNWGCIPTKSLLHSASFYRKVQQAELFGVKTGQTTADLQTMVSRSRAAAKRLEGGVAHLLEKHKVAVLYGTARLKGQGRVAVTSRKTQQESVFQVEHIVVATGARPRELPGMHMDGQQVWSSRDAMIPKRKPTSLLILGSGAIGCEFASFYHALGVETTLVEFASRVLPLEDVEVSAFVQSRMQARGIRILTGTKATGLARSDRGVCLQATKSDAVEGSGHRVGKEAAADASLTLQASCLLLAVGVEPNSQNLGLEQTRARLSKGSIETDEFAQTEEPGMYAIGDVAGAPMLAHKASHQAVVCVEKFAGLSPRPLKKERIPSCTYGYPEVASVGLTEAAANTAGLSIRVGRFPFAANGKAIAMHAEEGFVKTIFDSKSGALLGAHLVGNAVTELIHGFVLAMNLETTEEELLQTIFPHPTLSEAMHESVLAAYDRSLHI